MTPLKLTVTQIQTETPLIRSLTLVSANGQPLPAYTAGSHLKVSIPGQTEPRCYSLVCLAPDNSNFDAPQTYQLGVRLEDPSTGGSRYMHNLAVGDTLDVLGPKNDFALHPPGADEATSILVAGGIGITPIAAMASSLQQAQRPYQLHYYGRSTDQMAFLDTLNQQHGNALRIHADDDPATHCPLNQLLDGLGSHQHLYVCGPKGLIDTVVAESHGRHWPHSHVHFELFTTAAPQQGDRGFEIELRQSGLTLQVPPDKTILDVLEAAGCDPMYDCKRGECGVCQVDVLEGIPDHRDYYLSDDERAAGKTIQVCISRSLSDRLVLDL